MKLLIQRGQQAASSLPRLVFTLRVRAELHDDEEGLISKYRVGNALLYEGNRKEQIETAFGLAVLTFFVAAVFFYAIGFRVVFATGFGLILAVIAFKFIYQRIREDIYIDDLLEGRTFICRSVAELMEKEKLVEELCLDFKEFLEDMKGWEGEEVVDVVPTQMQP